MLLLNVTNSSEMTDEFILEKWSRFLDKFEMKTENFFIVYPTVMGVIFVISLIGNTLTCSVIYFDKSMHTTTNYYLFNLAVSDLLLTLFIGLEVVQQSILPSQYASLLLCKLHCFPVVATWNCSILTMTALAIERYIAVWYPLWLGSTQKWKRVLKIIILLWLIAIVETIPELMIVNLVKTSHSLVCSTVPTKSSRIVIGLLAITSPGIPLAIMAFVYWAILFKVNTRREMDKTDKIFNHRDPRGKVNVLVASLSVSFIIFWLPFFTMRIVFTVLDINQLLDLPQWWMTVFQIVIVNSWIGIIMNPILYSLISTKFRRSLKVDKNMIFDGNTVSSRYTYAGQVFI